MALPPINPATGKREPPPTKGQLLWEDIKDWAVWAVVILLVGSLFFGYYLLGLPIGNPGKNLP